MIAPRAGLLWAVGLGFIPLNLAAVLWPERLAFIAGAAALLAAALAADAFALRRRLAALVPVFPPAARFTLGKASRLPFEVKKAGGPALAARLRLELPGTLRSESTAAELAFAPGAETRRFAWPIRPESRGRARLRECLLETDSPLGWWVLRRRIPLDCEIRVYPRLQGGISQVSLPEETPLSGIHRRRQVGKGREFDKLREYLQGDDYQDIHWKATAKRAHPVTKVFQIENTQHVYAVIDASRLSAIPLGGPSGDGGDRGPTQPGHPAIPLEYYLRAALRLGLAAERQGDYYGLVLYAGEPLLILPAGKGKTHYGRFRDALYDLSALPGSPDYGSLFPALRLRLRKRALLLFLCALDEPALAESFAEHVGLLGRSHLVSVNSIRPPGVVPVFAEGPVNEDRDVYARLADQLYLRNLEQLGRNLRSRGVAFRAWAPERLSAEAVAAYLDAKGRQALA